MIERVLLSLCTLLLVAVCSSCSTVRPGAQQVISENTAQTRARTGGLAYEDGVHIHLDRTIVATNKITGEPILVEGRPILLADRSRASWNWNGDVSQLANTEVSLLHEPGSGFVAKTAGIGTTKETGVNLKAWAEMNVNEKRAAGEAFAASIQADWAGRVQLVQTLANGTVQIIDSVGRSIVVTPTSAAAEAVEKWIERQPKEQPEE